MIEPNPFYALIQFAGGYSLPRCLHVVADLGVADVLDETPRTPADLAASVGGGGRDHLLRAVLDSAPTAKGVIRCLPSSMLFHLTPLPKKALPRVPALCGIVRRR